jgi:hypothetical protein
MNRATRSSSLSSKRSSSVFTLPVTSSGRIFHVTSNGMIAVPADSLRTPGTHWIIQNDGPVGTSVRLSIPTGTVIHTENGTPHVTQDGEGIPAGTKVSVCVVARHQLHVRNVTV